MMMQLTKAKKYRNNRQIIQFLSIPGTSCFLLDRDSLGRGNKVNLKEITITELAKDEINSTKMRNDFYHFLSWKIHSREYEQVLWEEQEEEILLGS